MGYCDNSVKREIITLNAHIKKERTRNGNMPVIPALARQRQQHYKFEASLGYTVRS
jgi:hypothetical protein